MRTYLILCITLVLIACTHTIVGSQAYSLDGKYVFITESHGASGKAYTDKSDKKVYIAIKEKSKSNILFKRQIVLTAGNLKTDIIWRGAQQLTVHFFEGSGVNRKTIKTLNILKNDEGKFFVEQ